MKTGEIKLSEVEFEAHLPEIRAVRFTVFVEEQKVPAEIEMDEWDGRSRHVLAYRDGKAIGTGRLLPDGHIGRVAVLAECRGLGVGKLLMRSLIGMARQSGMNQVELSAQTHAAPFYRALGFKEQGAVYLEAGIEHIEMLLEFGQ